MAKEEPSLEMLWLQNIETMDKVQKIDCSRKKLVSQQYVQVWTYPKRSFLPFAVKSWNFYFDI
jgi:hypothetical protein